MLVYYYIMVGSSACILLYNGGFQCLYMVGSSTCILLYNCGFKMLEFYCVEQRKSFQMIYKV